MLAIDGWVCKTRQPTAKEVNGNIMAYRNRKGCWGILILAGCDADLKFHLFSAQNSGSTNDVVAWEMSALKAVQDNGLIPYKYFFVDDEAFNNGPQFLVPYSGSGIGSEKDSFNRVYAHKRRFSFLLPASRFRSTNEKKYFCFPTEGEWTAHIKTEISFCLVFRFILKFYVEVSVRQKFSCCHISQFN